MRGFWGTSKSENPEEDCFLVLGDVGDRPREGVSDLVSKRDMPPKKQNAYPYLYQNLMYTQNYIIPKY